MNRNQWADFSEKEAVELLFSCCGSNRWVKEMMAYFPFSSAEEWVENAIRIWYDICSAPDWTESFSHHPVIGDISSLKEKFAGKEQAGITLAGEEILKQLAKANKDYSDRNGFIFIVCATGKSAEEMLNLLRDRLANSREEEIRIAAGEQMKITLIRIQKLFEHTDWSFLKNSHITTHVLDTSLGKTGRDICIRLKDADNQTIAMGRTNSDGRIPDLLPPGRILPPGNYHMVFDTRAYFASQGTAGFYPEVDINFSVFDRSHYHIPLLINPFGYSTYRGS
jgi:5-hydroxyisourate hydrolase/2-oxo-4-hydroxy-4-carboxy-5-ureidoimidazoline decarboxylase